MHAALVARPGSCIRRLGGTRAREMQFTRFLRNGSVTAAEMSQHAGQQTGRRVAGREVVAIQDTSELVLGGRRARAAGYGPVGKGGALGGLLLHPVLAVEAGSEALLGLVSMQVWNRPGGGQRGNSSEDVCSKKDFSECCRFNAKADMKPISDDTLNDEAAGECVQPKQCR